MYQELQTQVFKWLKNKYNRDHNFTFSVRQKANKGAELNYFIGTEKSRYFSTTFWYVPVAYPGSSSDLINLVFTITRNKKIEFHLQFNQTKNPHDDQNAYALEFIQSIKPFFKEIFPEGIYAPDTNKMEFFAAYSKPIYSSFQELQNDLEVFLGKIIPIVDRQITVLKEKYPTFTAHRFSSDDQEKMFRKMEERFEKYKVIEELSDELEEEEDLVMVDSKIDYNFPLNQILYGPPGTGKTYNTINRAISIINSEFNLNQKREFIKAEYARLVDVGQIVFSTFHQSMSYEDFIEGIKPMIEEDTLGNKSVIYDVEDGIFKKIVNQAKKIEKVDRADIDWNNVDYYKMSLGGKSNPQEHSYCIHNNLGGISWGGANDLSELAKITDWSTYKKKFLEKFPDVAEKSSFNIQASFTLFRMKDGDIVIATRGNHIIDAIGKVSGSYIFNDENPTSLSHFRKIDWFAKDLNLSPEKFLKKNISQQSIYQFYNEDIRLESFKELTATNDSSVKNYVLIIDEINRGNVSQIFGEMITLIEEGKRIGNPEELYITLPYSKEKFGVPSNLYIIGTMNTADRSVEALDTALRRRFSFVEMMPDVSVVEKENFNDNYPRAEIMQKINDRIELLLDRNYTLGHSYFIKDDFKTSFKNEIIPLLQEYFYNDFGKIGLILGRGFVREKEISKISQRNIFADFETQNDIDIVKSYELIPFEEIEFEEALELLLV